MGESLIPVAWTGFSREHQQPGRMPAGLAAGAPGDRFPRRSDSGMERGSQFQEKLGFKGSGTRQAETRRSRTTDGPTRDLDPARNDFYLFVSPLLPPPPLKIKRLNQVLEEGGCAG